jgi:hypothetical protein
MPIRGLVRPAASIRVLALLMLGTSSAALVEAQAPSARDFSGVYFPAPGTGRQRLPNPLPYTPAAKELADAYVEQFRIEDDPGLYCIWPGMPRAPWGAPFAIEVFHRPQDLTIFWEGYGMYRKVYMADQNPPEAILPTAMGHSIAHWEDDVLVIETTHLKPYPYMNRFATTSDARIVERMWLETRVEEGQERKYLVDELVVTDPKIYTEPIRTRAEAVHRPDLTILEYTCSVSLWEQYLEEHELVLPDIDALPGPGD